MSDPTDAAVEVLRAVGKMLTKLEPDDVKGLLIGENKLVVVPQNWRPSSQPKRPSADATVDTSEIEGALEAMGDRAEAVRYIESRGMTVAQLRTLARGLKIYVPSGFRKPEVVERIVDHAVGRRLSSGAIRDGEWQS